MTTQEPKKWMAWLSLAEFWYNSTYHTAIKRSPFQALYGFPPPLIAELAIPGPEDEEAHDFLQSKQQMLTQLKENLLQAQNRMKRYADMKRVERSIYFFSFFLLASYRVFSFFICFFTFFFFFFVMLLLFFAFSWFSFLFRFYFWFLCFFLVFFRFFFGFFLFLC